MMAHSIFAVGRAEKTNDVSSASEHCNELPVTLL